MSTHRRLGAAPLAYLAPIILSHATQAASPQGALEEVVVRSTLIADDAQRSSITLLDSATIAERSAQHIEDVLSAAPNVNVASGASRGRFFQIRGIGERSQFVEPVNASVGTLLDGIDITGLGAAATLWDIEQVEVLRGPQGTLFGANALAGLLNLHSAQADSGSTARIQMGVENYDGWRVGAIMGTPLSADWHARVAVQQYRSDGYFDNAYLNRSDTNHRDELTARVNVSWVGLEQRVDLGLYRIDIDNGYDAFSLDNTRTTLSDQPGRDLSKTDAVRLRWQRDGDITRSVQLSHAATDTEYSYDEDWSYVGIAPGWEYSSFDRYLRDREMSSLEVRLQDDAQRLSWTIGSYLRDERESLERRYTYLSGPFTSELSIETAALFGQIAMPIGANLTGYIGARWEYRGSDYGDSQSVTARFSDTLWSGRAGLEWRPNDYQSLYVSVSRGVRGGGANADLLASIDALPAELAADLAPLGFFDAESLLNIEIGWRWRNAAGTLQSDLTLFKMARRDQQAKSSLVIGRDDGSTAFIDYTNNAARGSNDGLEWALTWAATDAVNASLSVGVLDGVFDRYITAEGDNLAGRDQPHAPSITASANVRWRLTSAWETGVEITTMDDFFFSDRHDTRSSARTLLNAHITWQVDAWRVQLWGRNLSDADYFGRGFGSFGNDPRKEYAVEPYYQYSEPRVVGLTVDYRL